MRFPLLTVQSVWFRVSAGALLKVLQDPAVTNPPTSSAGHCCWRQRLWFWDLVPPPHLPTLLLLPSWCPDLPRGQLFVWHHTPAFQGNKLLREAALHWTSLTANPAVPFPATACNPWLSAADTHFSSSQEDPQVCGRWCTRLMDAQGWGSKSPSLPLGIMSQHSLALLVMFHSCAIARDLRMLLISKKVGGKVKSLFCYCLVLFSEPTVILKHHQA